jgi:hypothetical protein
MADDNLFVLSIVPANDTKTLNDFRSAASTIAIGSESAIKGR